MNIRSKSGQGGSDQIRSGDIKVRLRSVILCQDRIISESCQVRSCQINFVQVKIESGQFKSGQVRSDHDTCMFRQVTLR